MSVPARSYIGLLVLGLGTLVGPLDSSVNIAFPYITGAFGVPLADIRWVIVSYVLTYSSLMLVFGKLGDQFGHRRIFAAGLAVSLVGFVLCARATTFEWLLAFRFLQGIGAALVLSCGPAIATSLFPEAYRSRVLGIYLLMFGIGSALGPSLGGLLVDIWGWQAVFWFRAPIAVAALLLVLVLPTPPRHKSATAFDLLGALYLAGATSAFLLTVTQLQRAEESPLSALVPTIIAVIAGWLYIRRAAAHPSPVIHLAIFRNMNFTLLNLANIFVNFAWFAVMLLVPYFLSELSGFTVGLGGFVLALSAFATMVAAPVGGWLIGRFAANRMALVGILLVAGASFLIGRWSAAPGLFAMAGPLLLSGVGTGLFQIAYMSIVTGAIPASERGVAGSLSLLTRTLGVVCSASFLTWIHAGFAARFQAAGLDENQAFLGAFQSTFAAAGAFLLMFLLVTLLRPGIWFGRQAEEASS